MDHSGKPLNMETYIPTSLVICTLNDFETVLNERYWGLYISGNSTGFCYFFIVHIQYSTVTLTYFSDVNRFKRRTLKVRFTLFVFKNVFKTKLEEQFYSHL